MDYGQRIFWTSIIISWFIIVFALFPARGQEQHDQHHAQYQDWQSTGGFNCCNDRDCGMLPDKDVREKNGETQVLVKDPGGDEWCPVTYDHLVSQKNGRRPSPDWSSAHACILAALPDRTACSRLKCFMAAVKF